ncbi:helix-turn-helix transcriptional regulator [Pseudomonas sp. GD03860]|uniref:helix-turn-helix transcriptional regulator n=1 Tax=Pseudomonas TaxID=286 RepID=UPI002363F28D|nr:MULTISPECIES: helix-turn-helix transcriptional regulator [Pseudomonas]MDD2058698.1 helix-turn-helix transcriptional regulator [Pseudomonas putida]MDH0636931.1 helix-turn-helix transcriptional regulator [Pseudomonas sp. GD03860]
MQSLFETTAHHHGLAKVIEQLGQPGFWHQVLTLLNQMMPFDNGLVIHTEADGVPRVLAEFDRGFSDTPSPMPLYLNGLYQLDPFIQAMHEGLADGVYRMEEVAPDEFRKSDYFQNYFRSAIGEDELQLILNLAPGKMLAISVGAKQRFETAHLGQMTTYAPWLMALLRQHWRLQHPAQEDIGHVTPVERALEQFGSDTLSARELEIARLVLRGNSSKAIAKRLAISQETVKVHRRNLYAKLGVSSQSELFSLFLQRLGQQEGE